ncbi:MAG: CopG family transcriptional regulator [Candidatus Thermoplasmatota archaeon]
MNRLSVSLNDKSFEIIQKYLSKYNTSQADIIRRALQILDIMEEATDKSPMENILTYIDYLANKEHIILDIVHWKLIFHELNQHASDNFWDALYKTGDNHRREYFDKGIREVKQILRYVEKTNWYTLKEETKNSFTLILSVAESSRFIKTFFEGFFSKYPQKVEIIEEDMKIRINTR